MNFRCIIPGETLTSTSSAANPIDRPKFRIHNSLLHRRGCPNNQQLDWSKSYQERLWTLRGFFPNLPKGCGTMTMKCIFRSGDNNGLQDELDKTTTRVERYNNRETGCMSEKPRLVSFMQWRCSRQDEWSSTDVQCRLNITGYLIGDRRTTFLMVQVNHCFPIVCLFGCTSPRPGSD